MLVKYVLQENQNAIEKQIYYVQIQRLRHSVKGVSGGVNAVYEIMQRKLPL